MIAACTPRAPGTAGAPINETSGPMAPAVSPRSVVAPDLPAKPNGVPAVYLSYPANPKRLRDDVPAKGGTVSVLKQGDVGQLPAVRDNSFWQELNKRVGATVELTQVVSADYNAKLATLVAGEDLPDLVQLTYTYPRLPGLLSARFQDLSPWLSGDGIRRWPNLASIPEFGWQSVSFNGGIWGIPWVFASRAGSENRLRQDVLSARGLSQEEVTDWASFKEFCGELTDPRADVWAISDLQSTALTMTKEMFGVVNGWAIRDGHFIRDFEVEGYADMLSAVDQLRRDGLIYPDPAATLNDSQVNFIAGRTVLIRQAWTNRYGLQARARVEGATELVQGGLVVPRHDGGGPADHFTNSGLFTFTGLTKASDDRIEELLGVLDWLASPFGSEERLFTRFGVPEVHYTLQGTDPVSTELGTKEVGAMQLIYLANVPEGIYMPSMPDEARSQYSHLDALLANVSDDASNGLYSEAKVTTGAAAEREIAAAQLDIVAGRRPVTDWPDVVARWQREAGDKIRGEYEQMAGER